MRTRLKSTPTAGHAVNLMATLAMVLVLIGTALPRVPAKAQAQAQTPRDIASGRVIVTLDASADADAVANRAIRQGNAEVR